MKDGMKLPISNWQLVLPEALHSLRSLLCTASNETPHNRIPTSFIKRHFASRLVGEFNPLFDRAKLIHSNQNYALVRAPPLNDNLANESEIMGQPKEVGGDYVSSKSGEIDPLIQENEVCKAEIAADRTNERHDVGESPNEIESFTVRR
ncbi:hypothetical protein GJ496_011887 [Pomphorhynchus laevis]|nr:hypothetical protein GJ496_011887 [Pomphorhynchus laevis]